jgi:hypothetical protein
MRRGTVCSTGVYLKDGEEKSLLYNDWDKNWGRREVYRIMMASIGFSLMFRQECPIYLTA